MHPTENDVIKYHPSKYDTNEKSSWSKLKMANWMQYPFSQWSKNAFHCARERGSEFWSFSVLCTVFSLSRSLVFYVPCHSEKSIRAFCVLKSNTECECERWMKWGLKKREKHKKKHTANIQFPVTKGIFFSRLEAAKEVGRVAAFMNKKNRIRNIVLKFTAWIQIKLWPNWDCVCVWTNLLGGNWKDVKKWLQR